MLTAYQALRSIKWIWQIGTTPTFFPGFGLERFLFLGNRGCFCGLKGARDRRAIDANEKYFAAHLDGVPASAVHKFSACGRGVWDP